MMPRAVSFHLWLLLAAIWQAWMPNSTVLAGPGDIDLSFTNGTGANAVIFTTRVRTNDNKIYIGGTFDGYNGTVIRRIARLSPSGALDASFATAGTDGAINAIALQPDLKAVIGGDFFGVGNVNSRRLARLNDDGSLDTAFTSALGTAADGGVDALALQADGKILLGGRFQNFNGTPRNRIARVNADGSMDTTFNPGTGPNQPVVSIQMQADGKIIVTGTFTTFNGVARSGIVRLNADGSVDTTFNPGTGASGLVNGAIIQADGKIIVYGGFNFFNGQARGKIIRLNADGTIDTGYAANTAINSDIRDAELMPDGKLLIVGVFFEINGVSRRSVARLTVNGAHDPGFNPGTGAGYLNSPANAAVNASALDTNSLLVVVGEFRQFNNIPFGFITRVETADPIPPLIITHPTNLFVLTGSTAQFSVTATGTAPLSYQWRFNGVNILGATNNPITIPNAQAGNAGLYSVVVSNGGGTATSSNASLTLGTLPSLVVAPPASQTNLVGENTNFTVTASGTAPLFFQWLFNGTALPGQTAATLNLLNLQLANAGVYSIVVSNQFGAITNSGTQVIAAPPAIQAGPNGGNPATGPPQSLTVGQGQTATFSANAVGSAPLTYQWRFNGVNIPGATASTLLLPNAQPSQAGNYTVAVSNPFGTTVSQVATLTVLTPPFPIAAPAIVQTNLVGQNTNFTVTAGGSAPLFYQWLFNGTILPGQTGPTLNLVNLQLVNAGLYSVIVSNQVGAFTNSGTQFVVTTPVIQAGPGGGDPATGQPQSLTVVQGQTATFSVNAVGTAPLTYQWRFNGVNIPGATASTLSVSNAQPSQAGNYSVVVSNPFGSTTSAVATLTVLQPPTIIVQPVSQTLASGATLNLSVTATGSPTLTYQWSFNGTAIPGATAPGLTLFNVQESLEGNYVCVVSNPYGTATSQVAVVTVQSPPSIFDLGQPAPQTVVQGSNATFTVSATGDQPFTYQWRFNGVNIPGATANPLVLTGVQTNQAGNYSVVVSNPFGSATSSNALLTVRVPPFIITQPAPATQTIVAGSNATITVVAGGDPTLTYQWRLNGTNLPGANAATLTLVNVQTNQLGLYSVVVSNPFGSVTSSNATLDVKAAPFIVTQPQSGHPQSLTVLQGSPAAFSVTVGGDGPFAYQWRFGGISIAGATNSSFGLGAAFPTNAGLYSVVITSPYGSVTSSNATLTVNVPPFIITQPTPATQTVVAGSTPTITVVAGGDPTLTYQWRLNGVNIPGANAATLSLVNVQTNQLGLYSVVVSNPFGSVTSSNATLDVKTAPFIVAQPQSGQPQSLTVLQGSPAGFSVTVGGDGPFSYQWRFGGVNIVGATNAGFGIASAFPTNAGLYSVVITSPYGSVTSSNATLTVNVPPAIVVPPVSQEAILGSNATFTVTATGDAPLSYQWRFNGVNIAGATGANFTVTNVQAASVGLYSVVVSNPFGTATSTNATILLRTPPFVVTAPQSGHPQSLTILRGSNATFTVTAGGSPPLAYQWLFNGTPIAGATNNVLNLSNVPTNQAGLYAAIVTSPYGSVTSSNATLTVLDPPVIIVQPASVSSLAGGTASFSVVAVGRPTLTYQWRKNGVIIAGATNTTFTVTNVSAADIAAYSVVVSNTDGTATSVNAALTLSNRTLQVVTTQTTNLNAGAAVAVPVALLAEGGENRVRASVAYDANKLTFINVTTPFTTATLTTTNALAAGQIGFDLMLPGATTLAAGSNPVVFLNFTVAAGVTQSIAGLTLQGIPTTNQVLDAGGGLLASHFLSGAVVFKATGTNAYQLRSQTGATEETLPIFNPAGSASALTFLRISFLDLGQDSLGNAIYLINATGTNGGVPYVLVPTTIAPAGSFPLNVEYYVSDRVTSPKPRLVIEVVTGGFPVAPAGTVLSPDRAEFHLGRFKIDFLGTAGKTYYIQYSVSPAGPWETSFPGVAGKGGRQQWVDTGPPRTTSMPTGAGTRFYRLLQVP